MLEFNVFLLGVALSLLVCNELIYRWKLRKLARQLEEIEAKNR